MKKVYLFCDKRSLNDATLFYVNVVKSVLEEKDYNFIVTNCLPDIRNAACVFTITGKYFFLSKLRHPFVKTIYWAQGVAAEEAKMANYGWLSYISRYFFERFAVLKTDLLFLVSEEMLKYFKRKYNYNKTDYIIMPCFNQTLSPVFDVSQYDNPTFVYAGSASVWQGVDIMLDVYKQVESSLKKSHLTILSNQKALFEKKMHNRGIINYEIKYLPLEEINEELHKFKYGFILREPHVVNKVATPTKMNSYLSQYVIPIFSDAVSDFLENIKLGEFTLMFKCPLDVNNIAKKIVEFELNNLDYHQFQEYVMNVFANHYNFDKYKDIIKEKLEDLNFLKQ